MKSPRGPMPLRDQIVVRMTEEQSVQGMSDQGLASRISEYYPMSATTVWKLKNSTPPRGVSLDEAHAIARAFGFESIERFLDSTSATNALLTRLDRAADFFSLIAQRQPLEDFYKILGECILILEGDEELLKKQGLPNAGTGKIARRDATKIQDRLDEVVSRTHAMTQRMQSVDSYVQTLARKAHEELRNRCPDLPIAKREEAKVEKT